MLHSVITTIQNPTASVLGLVKKLNEVGGKLIVAGDRKGPVDFNPPTGEWRSTFALRGSGVTMVTGGGAKEESRAAASGGVAGSVSNVKGRKGGDENQSLTAWIFKIKKITL